MRVVAEAPASVAGPRGTDGPTPGSAALGNPAVEARPEAPLGAPAVEARIPEARTPEVKAPDVRPAAAVRAPDQQPDKQTVEARAMADVMSSGSQPRGARTPAPAVSLPASPAADPHPAVPAVPASDIRTGSAATAGAADTIMLPRGEVDRALADFAGLAAAVRGNFSASGLAVDAVGEATVFQRAGLRAGDVITAVDGARLRSLDDAANLYARASTASALTAQIVRGGKPMTLHVAIR